jgi:hypothetical protein
MNMKKQCIRFVELLRDICRAFARTGGRNHDPLLVNSLASFNFEGGWRELLLKTSLKHMPAESTIALIDEPVGV